VPEKSGLPERAPPARVTRSAGALRLGGGGRPAQDLGSRSDGRLAAHVDVRGHRRVAVTELIGDLAGTDAGLVEAGRAGLAEGVGGDPVEPDAVEEPGFE
jgi:hypothetical protein